MEDERLGRKALFRALTIAGRKSKVGSLFRLLEYFLCKLIVLMVIQDVLIFCEGVLEEINGGMKFTCDEKTSICTITQEELSDYLGDIDMVCSAGECTNTAPPEPGPDPTPTPFPKVIVGSVYCSSSGYHSFCFDWEASLCSSPVFALSKVQRGGILC